MGIAHWDEVESFRRDRRHLAAEWTALGSAAGSYRCGVNRIRLAAGEQPTPAHVHGEAEEIFYVVGGSGLTWMDGKTFEVREGDCIVYRNSHEAHTLRGGDDGLDVLAFGAREYFASGSLPEAGVMWGLSGVIEEKSFDELHPWDREPELEWPEPSDRPATIVNVADVEPDVRGGRRRRDLARAAGSRWTGLKHIECDAGTLAAVPHVHTMEEELFVVLDGVGTLELTPAARNTEPEQHPVRRGSVVARPPATGVAHTFRAGEGGLSLLAWGTREPGDIVYYPRSKKVFFQGLGIAGRIELVDYWEDEEL